MSDMLGNKYKTECRLSLDVGVDSFRMAVTVGDEVFEAGSSKEFVKNAEKRFRTEKMRKSKSLRDL